LAGAVVLVAALASCGGGDRAAPRPAGRGFLVVAAENFWGSIAAQLAGTRAAVASLIINPGTDPHSYMPSARDSRLLAQSRLAIVNGIGYDRWAGQAVAANPDAGRVTLDTGVVLGLRQGANPHQWYAPGSVLGVVDAIVADYVKLDPGDAGYFAQRRRAFLTGGLARYDQLRAQLRRRFAGVRVGYSESIFGPLAADLGLVPAMPVGFAKAVAEGAEITAQDRQETERALGAGEVAVWVYNSQNVTPDVQRVNALAAARRIPIVAVTETLSPAGATFQAWQVAQLEALRAALHRATGR